MAEYKSFHYQMHQVPEVIKPNYITAPKALTFCELYSPRKYNENVQISQCEKSFWRTRDRVEFTIYENRTNKIVFVTSRNLDNQDVYRTIFLSADVLFFEVESKAKDDNRVRLVRKRDKILNTDELLHKAAADYIYARLNITADPVAWPDFSANQASSSLETGASNANITTPTTPTEGEQHPDLSAVLASLLETSPAVPSGPAEKMVVFNRLSSDHYAFIESGPPEALPLRGIPNIKTEPTIPTVTATAEPPAATAAPGSPVPPISLLPLGASAEGAVLDTPGIAVAPADPTAPSSTATGPTPAPTPHPAPARVASGKLPTPTGSAPTTARMNMPLLNIPPINTLHAAASKKVTPTSSNSSSKNMVKSRSTVLVRNVSGVTATPHATPTAANIAGTATVTATAATTTAASPVSSAISPSSAAAAVKHNTTPTNATSTTATTATSSTIAEKAATTTSEKEAATSSAVLDTPVAAPAVKKAASTPTRSRATIISRSTKVVPT